MFFFQWVQTNTQRTYLRGKYTASKLYQVKDIIPGGGQLDLAVRTGDLIAVIQNKDPSGNRERWYCDNGHKQVNHFQKRSFALIHFVCSSDRPPSKTIFSSAVEHQAYNLNCPSVCCSFIKRQ